MVTAEVRCFSLKKKFFKTRYSLLDRRNVGLPKENNRVNFQDHKFGVILITLPQVSTKYSKHHNHHHLNTNKVAILRCNPEISPNNKYNAVRNGDTPWYYR